MDLTRLTDHPELLDKETLFELRRLTALYPYYQPARLLMLQNLYLLHDSSFEEEMRRAAVYITNRKTLFDLVESAHYRLHQDTPQSQPAAPKTNGSDRTLDLIDGFLDSEAADPTATPSPAAPVRRKPTPTDATVDYTAYLMTLDSPEPEKAEEETPQLKGQNLIDNFLNDAGGKIQLKENPEYTPQLPENNGKSEKEDDEGYFTETLAGIYIKQGRYSKALEIIQRLNLNYPKKNAYFADQIRFLQKLILNNNNNK